MKPTNTVKPAAQELKTNQELELTEILRAGDPGEGSQPMSSAETARMRAHVQAASRVDRSRPWMPWALATAALATAAEVLIAAPNGLFPAGSPTTTPPSASPGVEGPVATNRREIHFTAPNGTRIIWSLRKDGRRPEQATDPEDRS